MNKGFFHGGLEYFLLKLSPPIQFMMTIRDEKNIIIFLFRFINRGMIPFLLCIENSEICYDRYCVNAVNYWYDLFCCVICFGCLFKVQCYLVTKNKIHTYKRENERNINSRIIELKCYRVTCFSFHSVNFCPIVFEDVWN